MHHLIKKTFLASSRDSRSRRWIFCSLVSSFFSSAMIEASSRSRNSSFAFCRLLNSASCWKKNILSNHNFSTGNNWKYLFFEAPRDILNAWDIVLFLIELMYQARDFAAIPVSLRKRISHGFRVFALNILVGNTIKKRI